MRRDSLRCPRCGNENPDNNRFCGMCGATLLAPPAPAAAPPQPVSVAAPKPPAMEAAAAPAPAPEPRRSATAVSETPAISGPSFLGLNQPASSPRSSRKRASLSIDPHSGQGSNLDYLLDEEEPSRPWGIGKILVIMIALGLAVGFGYLRFKNQGLAWLSGLKKPASVAQNSTSPDTTNQPAPSSSITPETQPPAQPTPQPSLPGPSTGQPLNPQETSVPASSSPVAPAAADTAKPADSAKSTDAEPAPAPTEKATSPADTSSHPTDDSADTPAAATPPESAKPAAKSPTPKPSAASKPAAPYDAVSEAQKYLYGRGASQDCDRGMRLLKPQANKANPKAMIEMGALYSAGLCTPRDLPTAYRWFAMALRKDPDNTALHADLTKLWGEMTQPERQLAIKMTQ